MELKFKQAIYLVEKPGKVMDAVKKAISDRMDYLKLWQDWAKEHIPENKGVLKDRYGYIYGFKFDQLPDGWRKPDKYGASMPKVKNPIRATMPPNKRYRDEREYFKDIGINVPLDISIYNADGSFARSWGIGHWFNPVKFVYTKENKSGERLMGVVLPDYASEIGEARLKLAENETMVPSIDFDYENMLEGCRIIPEYEWRYLAEKWGD